MPQLDPTWFISQFFWLCICFFFMLFLMSKIFIPKIKDILEQRQRKIDDYLVKAHQIKEQAEESLKKYNEALVKATADANEALENARKEMNVYIAKKQDELTQKLNTKLLEGEAQIKETREKALKEVKNISQDWALDIVKKLELTKIDAEDIKKGIEKVVNH